MFRKREEPAARRPLPGSHEARLRALGLLLDRAGYADHGLCILEVAGDFVVSGLLVQPGQATFAATARTETITAAELAAVVATP
jgi:hypothetical protein